MNITDSMLVTDKHSILLDRISSVAVKRMLKNDIIGWPLSIIAIFVAISAAESAQGWDNEYIGVIVLLLLAVNFLFNNYQVVVSTTEGHNLVLLKRVSKSAALREKARVSEAVSRREAR